MYFFRVVVVVVVVGTSDRNSNNNNNNNRFQWELISSKRDHSIILFHICCFLITISYLLLFLLVATSHCLHCLTFTFVYNWFCYDDFFLITAIQIGHINKIVPSCVSSVSFLPLRCRHLLSSFTFLAFLAVVVVFVASLLCYIISVNFFWLLWFLLNVCSLRFVARWSSVLNWMFSWWIHSERVSRIHGWAFMVVSVCLDVSIK